MSDTIDLLRNRLNDKDRNAIPSMAIVKAECMEVTADQLKKACEANPSHPVAEVYGKAVDGLDPSAKVNIEVVDLQALLDDLDTEVVEAQTTNGRIVRSKKLGAKRTKDTPVRPTPRPRPEPTPAPTP